MKMSKKSIVDQCGPCLRHDGKFCIVYEDPAWHWRNFESKGERCQMTTERIVKIVEGKKKKTTVQPKHRKPSQPPLTEKQKDAYRRFGGD